MEARGLIDEVILQKDAYGGRSLQHQRLARKEPERCSGEDEGLFAVLLDEFGLRAKEFPLLFDPKAPEVSVRPSIAALKRCIALLSGTLAAKGQVAATDEVFTAPDALGWTYQYWNTEEKDRVFEKVRTKKGAKIEGAEIIPATCIYTEPYMVKFLVQNSLGAMWMGLNPGSQLCREWEYYVRDVGHTPVAKKSVSDITFLDPACGSGHFLIEAFELFYAMYAEEGALDDPVKICDAILARNLYGIDIDERAVQIAAVALVMKAKEKAPKFVPRNVNLVATNIRLPAGDEQLEAFLRKHPEDAPLNPALLAIFEGLAHADELGSLLQIEEPVEKELRALQARCEAAGSPMEQFALWGALENSVQGKLPTGVATYEAWEQRTLVRIRKEFDAEAHGADLAVAFFGEAAGKGVSLVDMLTRRYDVVAANPPYMGRPTQGRTLRDFLETRYGSGCDDLWAAFCLRQQSLAASTVAMVHQDALLFVDSFSDLRARLIEDRALSLCCHVGPHGFDDISGEKVSVCLSIIRRQDERPTSPGKCTFLDIADGRSAADKQRVLRNVITDRCSDERRFIHPLSAFSQVPGSRFAYRLSGAALDGFGKRRALVGEKVHFCNGMFTAYDDRFLRRRFEVAASPRWKPYAKYPKGRAHFDGSAMFVVDWREGGDLVRLFRKERGQSYTLPGEEHFDRAGIALPRTGDFHSMLLPGSCAFDTETMGGFPKDLPPARLAAFFWAPATRFILDALEPGFHTSLQVIRLLPLPAALCDEISCIDGEVEKLLALRRLLVERTDATLRRRRFVLAGESLASAASSVEREVSAAVVAGSRSAGELNSALGALTQLQESDERTALRLGVKYDPGSWLPDNVLNYLNEPRWPTEWVHDLVMCVLGHRWPDDEAPIGQAREDREQRGIVPLVEGPGWSTLLARVRHQFANEFDPERAGAIEREFEKIVGKSLGKWLASEFFKWHVSVFKKRPIAWQIESTPLSNEERRSRRAASKTPAFSCVVHYHQLDSDLLPKIRTQLLGPLRTSVKTELAGLERLYTRTAHQDARRFELEEKVEELEAFDTQLERVIFEGFASTVLDELAAKEPLDRWSSRDGQVAAPSSREAFLAQERKYDPDLNDGVRVNIAPLQRAGLLAADVLAGKDVDKAIADRAEWRAGERCWCREGKLASPSWWPEGPDAIPPCAARSSARNAPVTEGRA
jgi:hypothetical protein